MGPSTRPSARRTGPRRHSPGALRRRGGAAVAALLMAATLGLAGCSASSDNGSAASDKAAAPMSDGGRSVPEAGQDGGSGSAKSGSGAVPEGTGGAGGTSPSAPSAGSGTGPGKATAPPSAPKYLVRTADLSIRTPHVEEASLKARTLVAAAGGYAGDENTSVDAQGHATSTIQLRVPPAAYDQLLDDLGKLGTLLGRKVSVDDVTGQVVDVQSRIKSQQASVDRVRKLMNQASGLTDVVQLESELSTRESALEALEAQQASLRAQADLATVTLQLSEPPVKAPVHKEPEKKKDGFWKTVGNALAGGWHAFYLTVRAVLVVISALLPFLAVVALLLLVWRALRWWRPRPEPTQEPPAVRQPAAPLPKHPAVPGARGGVPEQDLWAPPPAPPVTPPESSGEPREERD
ncbi:DUF4349 domain-containing protein [Actinacidiphila bryophytorum]|uniref:DUF4349 domain-containing protein n=1 Tax=Actinacidiphila bryophytorum TaxID=1436133 RepID=A0A9W4MJC5_9ACTN|nr:DUF4349 domain-containing protein [Actinacidiphila bryophytorum]MBM9436708.1 DUF4349 domain-containing protein [Actinacidiphila bryophytorum]MBN6546660.1 DUF4349 domain-containing protein [Actinacidiphila bryophytorum]CAG7654069.1 conserved exported hypothetical protein [Actinacidiphila bryophytorum]